jgi:hypothetical protein
MYPTHEPWSWIHEVARRGSVSAYGDTKVRSEGDGVRLTYDVLDP